MAGRFSSSNILRPALAAHAGLSATSLLCSAFGPSQFESPTTMTSTTSVSSRRQRPSPSSCHHRTSEVCATALPWLDQLHAMIAGMYVTGGLGNSLCRARHHDVTVVRLGEEASFENPVVSYAGAGEIERSFRARLLLHFQNEVETVLECVNVEASQDSISGGGGGTASAGQHPREQEKNDYASTSLSFPASPIPSSNRSISSSPPKVEVTYRLSQQYGAFFSVQSLLVVTVQVRRGSSQKDVRKITSQKAVVPLATSGFTPRAASAAAAAATSGQYAGTASLALTRAANKIREATTSGGRCLEAACTPPSQISSPLVAEVVRIEERWNGVQLIRFGPFHWSRRLNGLVAGSATFFFFH